MTQSTSYQLVVSVIRTLAEAIEKLRIHSNPSQILEYHANRVYQQMIAAFENELSFSFEIAGEELVVAGIPMASNQHDRFLASLIVAQMRQLDIAGVTFKAGLVPSELTDFIEFFSGERQVQTAPAFEPELRDETHFVHIACRPLYSSFFNPESEITENAEYFHELLTRILGQASNPNSDAAEALIEDGQELKQVIQLILNDLLHKQKSATAENRAEYFLSCFQALEIATPHMSREVLVKAYTQLVLKMDTKFLINLLSYDPKLWLGGEREFLKFIDQMDDRLFDELSAGLKRKLISRSEAALVGDGTRIQGLSKAYQIFIKSTRGERLKRKQKATSSGNDGAENRVGALLDGDYSVLLESSHKDELPSLIVTHLASMDLQESQRKMVILTKALSHGNWEVRHAAAEMLFSVEDELPDETAADLRIELQPAFIIWIEAENEATLTYQKIAERLGEKALNNIKSNKFAEALIILKALDAARLKGSVKKQKIQNICETVLWTVATKDILKRLVTEYQSNREDQRNQASECLICLSPASVMPFLDLLLKTDEMPLRVRIIGTISAIGTGASPALRERLGKQAPWYFYRNLLLILSRVGSPDDVDLCAKFMEHSDSRVRCEAIGAIQCIGGERAVRLLQNALFSTDDSLKIAAIRGLGAMGSHSAIEDLSNMLRAHSPLPSKRRIELEEALCTALGSIGSKVVIPLLQEISDPKGLTKLKNYHVRVRAAAKTALETINTGTVATPASSFNRVLASASAKPDLGQSIQEAKNGQDSANHKMALAKQYLNRGEITPAVEILLQLVSFYSQNQDFVKAEAAMNKIIDADPTLMAQTVQAGDIIEQAKNAAMDKDHLNVWAMLYNSLSTQEAHALYFNLKPQLIQADQTIYAQGERNDTLYFINSGQLKLIHRFNDDEVLIKALNPGDLAGVDSFFFCSICTTSLVALSFGRLFALDRAAIKGWTQSAPALESKLMAYSREQQDAYEILKEKGVDRRIHKRYASNLPITVKIHDIYGKETGKQFHSQLVDISRGGLSCDVKIHSDTNNRLLIGRRISMCVTAEGDASSEVIDKKGVCAGISTYSNNKFKLHMKFDALLSDVELKRLFSSLAKSCVL